MAEKMRDCTSKRYAVCNHDKRVDFTAKACQWMFHIKYLSRQTLISFFIPNSIRFQLSICLSMSFLYQVVCFHLGIV